jgi:phenylalanyl-tRNA synthetase alpha subunit
MHNFETKYQAVIFGIMTNKDLSEDERSKIIADMMSEFKNTYPQLQDTATRQELSETELRLTKEIKEIDANLRKEIESVRLEIKDLDVKLEQNKTDILKWMFGMFVTFSGLFLAAAKYL